MSDSTDTTPGKLDEIQHQLRAGDKRMTTIERQLEENTRITQESKETLQEVRDALVFARVGTKIVKWLGGLGAVAVSLWQLWHLWRKP